MSVFDSIKQRLDKLLNESKDNKILLLDDITINIIELTYTTDQIVKYNITIIRNIKNKGEKLPDLKALAILSIDSINFLQAELKDPKFAEYKIHFIERVEKIHIKQIAESDRFKLVKDMSEIYINYKAIDTDIAILPEYNLYNLLLGLRISPIIRYQGNSIKCKETIDELNKIISSNRELFSFLRPVPKPLLIVIDRNDDLLTPLLIPDTYQAMISEFCEYNLNRVVIDKKDHVLSCVYDDFYKKNRFEDYEIFTKNIGNIIKEYKEITPKAGNDIKQMSKIIDNFQRIQTVSNDVKRHVSIMEEINKNMGERKIFDIIGIEREILSEQNPSEHCAKLLKIFFNTEIDNREKIRLMLIFCYKYRGYDKYIKELSKILYKLDRTLEETVKKFMIEIENENIPLYSKPIMGFKIIGEKYKSKIERIYELINIKKLNLDLFPFVEKYDGSENIGSIIIYVIGGITLTEYKIINSLNKLDSDKKIAVTLCSDKILTTTQI